MSLEKGIEVEDIWNTWGFRKFFAFYNALIAVRNQKTAQFAMSIRAAVHAEYDFASYIDSLVGTEKTQSVVEETYTEDDIPICPPAREGMVKL